MRNERRIYGWKAVGYAKERIRKPVIHTPSKKVEFEHVYALYFL